MVNCLVVDDEALAREAIINYINRLPDLHLVAECENALVAMQEIRSHKIDLIFLDIEMPEIDGIRFLQSIKNVPGVIFTTAYRNYAVDAFDLDVIDFLLKPISFERFLKGIDKFYQMNTQAQPKLLKEKVDKIINVKADRKTYKVDLSSVQYFESLKDYVKIVCDTETIVTHETITYFEQMLQHDDFIRIHRSFLVAKGRIQSFDSETVYLCNKELPVSRTYKQAALAKLARS